MFHTQNHTILKLLWLVRLDLLLSLEKNKHLNRFYEYLFPLQYHLGIETINKVIKCGEIAL